LNHTDWLFAAALGSRFRRTEDMYTLQRLAPQHVISPPMLDPAGNAYLSTTFAIQYKGETALLTDDICFKCVAAGVCHLLLVSSRRSISHFSLSLMPLRMF
jgi:hypothetical protein